MKHVGSVIICMRDPYSICVTNNDMGITDGHSKTALYIDTNDTKYGHKE